MSLARLSMLFVAALCASAADYDYKLLATSKTSTMEKEMNEAAQAGYVFAAVMGGETGFGGKEVVVIMAKDVSGPAAAARRYKLLATSKTSTLEKEMQRVGSEGFEYKGQTVFESAFGGREVSVIMELDPATPGRVFSYRLLATIKTSTMQKELNETGKGGYLLLGMTVGKTAFGGSEVVSILARESGGQTTSTR